MNYGFSLRCRYVAGVNILLIAPASHGWLGVGRNRWFNGRTFRFTLHSLLAVAAATPEGHTVEIVDEQVDEVPWEVDYDLVGITCMTAAAPRAYEIARSFRARGIPVVLGGMHPSLCPEEALEHSDAIVIGEAEEVWPQLVEDTHLGRPKRIYRNLTPPDLRQLRLPPRHLLKEGAYAPVYAIQASRGCSNHCRFCSVAAFSSSVQRYRPVPHVVEELRRISQRYVIFIDDNLMAQRDYARTLFQALVPLQKRWITQSSLDSLGDESFVQLASKAGCVGVFVGLETFGARNLASMDKAFNRLEQYGDVIRRLHRHGIGVEAGIVVGLPHDRPEVFQETLRALDDLEVDAIQVSCCTPLPGTPLYQQMKNQIVDRDWSHYDFHHVVFRPIGMTGLQLQQGHDWLTREFYRPWRIMRRLGRLLLRRQGWRILPFAAVVNLAYLGRVIRWRIRGANPTEAGPQTKSEIRIPKSETSSKSKGAISKRRGFRILVI
jgi:radical SAM superfamily enzyme YgiQ (UPF0313 family)